MKVKLHIINKVTTVPASYGKKNENILKTLTIQEISDNRIFWKTVKPMFSNKSANRESVSLVKCDKTLSENLEVAELFNAFFQI